MVIYLLCLLLFCVGLYAVVIKRNLIRIIIGLGVMEYAINLFFILIGYQSKGRAPILANNQKIVNMVDPLPQALVLTSIVIGLSVTALLISIAIRLYEKYGTFDVTQIRKLKG